MLEPKGINGDLSATLPDSLTKRAEAEAWVSGKVSSLEKLLQGVTDGLV